MDRLFCDDLFSLLTRVEVEVRFTAGTAWPPAPTPKVVVEKNSEPPTPLPMLSCMLKKLLRPIGPPNPKPIGEKNGLASELLGWRETPPLTDGLWPLLLLRFLDPDKNTRTWELGKLKISSIGKLLYTSKKRIIPKEIIHEISHRIAPEEFFEHFFWVSESKSGETKTEVKGRSESKGFKSSKTSTVITSWSVMGTRRSTRIQQPFFAILIVYLSFLFVN